MLEAETPSLTLVLYTGFHYFVVVNEMGELRVVIPNDLHRALKLKALEDKKTLKELVIKILKEGVNA